MEVAVMDQGRKWVSDSCSFELREEKKRKSSRSGLIQKNPNLRNGGEMRRRKKSRRRRLKP